MSDSFISIQFDKSHLSTIGQRLYTQSLDLIRELVANGYDADVTQVRLTISDSSIVVSSNPDGTTSVDQEWLNQILSTFWFLE